ncbi:MAG: hypothetical protein CMB80_01100 [Flammeovirgaceae bacterium]|nr:hypothetical protein [Flammeovirgaceae bacterium]|tara:strand:+ start:1999 stop:2376 length:378 start_codon:yes stop_codon:yes gene_type:complete
MAKKQQYRFTVVTTCPDDDDSMDTVADELWTISKEHCAWYGGDDAPKGQIYVGWEFKSSPAAHSIAKKMSNLKSKIELGPVYIHRWLHFQKNQTRFVKMWRKIIREGKSISAWVYQGEGDEGYFL